MDALTRLHRISRGAVAASLLVMLAAWNDLGGRKDLDGNGVVDFGDLLILLANWGPCV